jgi:trans-aconitate methyltransferase
VLTLNRLLLYFRNTLTYAAGFGSPVSRDLWEQQYSNGDWRFLDSDQERHHHNAIASLYRKLGKDGRLLDIGCGPGVLRSALSFVPDERYMGIDLSEEAIRQARHKFPSTPFFQGNAENLILEDRFDVLIFNEVVYYFARPCDTVKKYLSKLTPNGLIIISMCRYPGHDSIWRGLDRFLNAAETISCKCDDAREWVIKAYRVAD